MSDLESLQKNIVSVIGQIQELISNQNIKENTLDSEPRKLKKTPDMTYNEFLKKALSSKKPIEIHSKKSSYRLQEDLQLLLDLSQHSQISIKTFEEISSSKKINRTTESLKSRYHDYLYRIDEKDMKKIVSWIQKEGVEGFLTFDGEEMRLQLNDPRQNKQAKRHRAISQSEVKKNERLQKNSRLKNLPTNCKELSQILKLYSKMVNVPVQTLTQKLDQLSGDIGELDNYIETKDARMLWTSQEDEILRKGGPELQILRRYRGNGVEVRKKYLGIA